MLVNPGKFAYRSDILKPNIGERLIPTFVSSLTSEPNLEHVRWSMGIAPLLFQIPKSLFTFRFITMALLDAWTFFFTPCVRRQIRPESCTALVKRHGMPVGPNVTVCHGEWKPLREQTDGVHAVPENGRDNEWE